MEGVVCFLSPWSSFSLCSLSPRHRVSFLTISGKISMCGAGSAGCLNCPSYKRGWLKEAPFLPRVWAQWMTASLWFTTMALADFSPACNVQIVKQQIAIQCSFPPKEDGIYSHFYFTYLVWPCGTHYSKRKYTQNKYWVLEEQQTHSWPLRKTKFAHL